MPTPHERPLSPHLQVYQLPLAGGLLSITHRLTGVFLSVGTLLLVYWLMAIAGGPESYAQAQKLLGSPVGIIVLILWSYALFFHLCNGIRHLFWDAGYGFDLKTAAMSAKLVLIASLVLTALAWGIAFI